MDIARFSWLTGPLKNQLRAFLRGMRTSSIVVDIFGNCSLRADVPNSSSVEQLVEHNYYAAASRQNRKDASHRQTAQTGGDEGTDGGGRESERSSQSSDGSEDGIIESPPPELSEDTDELNSGISKDTRANAIFQQAAREFRNDVMRKEKIHRYPASLAGSIDKSYVEPKIVAIGPYHRHHDRVKQAEEVKHAAAYHCISDSGSLLEELYEAVVHVADQTRHLYDKEVMAKISYEDFRHMMFFDACFLVQFMLMRSRAKIHPSLHRFLSPNRCEILHDALLLENQIPWRVVKAVMSFRPVSLTKFLGSLNGCLQDRKLHQRLGKGKPHRKPPHLLGLFRYYIVGTSHTNFCRPDTEIRSVSQSALELAEIGVKLTTNDTGKLVDMQLNQEGTLLAKLSLAPLSPDRDRASYLVNMAALELCTVESFSQAKDEDSAVCSYLLLLAMLAYREEDVHELRTKGLLQGGGGLTNQEALAFFTSLQGLRLGSRYNGIMRQIESYKEKKWITKPYACVWNNWKTIVAFGSAIVGLFGIIGTLASIKSAL